MGKRKRSRPLEEGHKPAKVEKEAIIPVKHPALGLYYRQIWTLKDYLLSKLPSTSKARRRKILSILPITANSHNNNDEENSALSQNRHCLSKLLNDTLVCAVHERTPTPESSRMKDFGAFSQHFNSIAGSSVGGSTSSLSELVDYAIWQLFHKVHRHAHRPPHLLCHGFQRASSPRQINKDHCAIAGGIPGIVSHYPNAHVNALKGSSWTEILGLLGQEGDSIMLDLILDCGVFLAGDEGLGNYYQLSGNCPNVLTSKGRAYL